MSGESKEQKDVIDWVMGIPDVWLVKFTATVFSKKGIPDLILCIRGRFVGIEMKRPKGGVRSPLQKREREKILKSGGICEFCETAEKAKTLIQEVLDGKRV